MERFYTGVISQRNKLAVPIKVFGRRLIELYDAILSGSNAEISVRSTLQRAAGFLQYNTNAVSGIPQKFYAFQPVSTGSILPIIDTTAGVFYVPPGSTAPTSLITKTQGKQSSFFGVGNYLYIGNSEFSNKWDGPSGGQGITKWGIAIGSINVATGPNPPTVAADVAASPPLAWANPNNIKVSDGAFATVTVNAGGSPASQGPDNCTSGASSGPGNAWSNPSSGVTMNGQQAAAIAGGGTISTQNLLITGFGFTVPSNATITGFSFTLALGGPAPDAFANGIVTALKAGAPVGTAKTPGTFVPTTFGTSIDLWGTTWSPTDINSASFGVQYSVSDSDAVTPGTYTVSGIVTATVYYTLPPSSTAVSDFLQGTSFGFSIPATSTISGILVEVQGLQTQNQNTSLLVTMLKSGNAIGTTKSMQLPASNGFVSYGGTGDLWGATWTPNDINQTTFGISLQASTSNSVNTTWSVDFVRITIYGTGGPTVVVNAGAGTFSATQGYQYLFVFGNSNDNNISNPTPASLSTGVFTSKLRVEITLTASTDPQVNQIRVFRTTDTGTGAIFFELPNSPFPNTSATVFDTAADNTLQVAQAVIVGTLNFSPPPPGLVNIEWYAGRLWGSVGNLLYFSAGPDNAPMGRGTSNWPPGNVFELPTQIVKNVALNGGNGMLVVTLDGIHVVQGISNPGFTVNKWLSDIGARQQNAVDTDGSNIYIFTSDRQFLRISSQGIEELSQNISDQTDLLDPTQVYVCQHRSGSQDSRVFLTDGVSKWLPYNLMMGAWEPAKTPVDGSGIGAIASIEIRPGIWKLLKGDTRAGQVLQQRDQNTFSDNGTNYTWNVVFGNIPLADPSQLANVESIIGRFTNVGNIPTVSVLPNDISGSFLQITRSVPEPPEASNPPTGHLARKYYLGDSPAWSQMTHLQIQFSWIAEAFQNEMLSFGIFPNQSADQQQVALPQIQGR